ncbi:MAG: hypothetical protein WC979_00760 [Candidatus Pacearchaeota archaeon]|jgi:hypothetical protein|nr:hypothetical protein [Clostridia bacterium]
MIKETKICPHCGKEFPYKGIATHIWRMHGDGQNHNPNIGYANGSREIWNKGLSKETSDAVAQMGKTLSAKIANGEITPSFLGKTHTAEQRKKTSERMSLHNPGGKCKWFEYEKANGDKVKVQGTWELRFAKVLDLIDNEWIKIGVGNSTHSYEWEDESGITHMYTPDFYSPKLNKYFEVKGYWWGDDKNKMIKVQEQHNLNIEIIQKKELAIYEKLIT